MNWNWSDKLWNIFTWGYIITTIILVIVKLLIDK